MNLKFTKEYALKYLKYALSICMIILIGSSFGSHAFGNKLNNFLSGSENPLSEADMGTLKGRIYTSDDKPAAFVSIALKGTSFGASTNDQGNFQFRAQSGSYTLVISSVGLEKQEMLVLVKANETTVIPTITLKESLDQLREVVVRAVNLDESYKASLPSQSLRLQAPLLQTPQNIQVITNKIIADQQIFDMLEGVSRNVSGVTRLEHWDNYARLNMRGSRIAPFRNGMNIQSSWGPLAEDMSMVERIEFVKGPAGFMMSNGEPSGFYNVVTKKPTGISQGIATMTLGSFDTYRATADIDGILSIDNKLLYRVNVMGQLKGSHRDFEFNNRYSIAPVLKYQVNNQTSITAEYTYQFLQQSIIGSAYVFSANGYGNLPNSLSVAEPNLDPSNIKDHSAFLIIEHNISDNWKLTGQLAYFNYDQTGSSLWIDSARTNGDLFRNVSIWDANNESKFGQLFLNGKLQTGKIGHRVLGGLDIGNKNYMADWNQSFKLTGVTTFNIYNPQYGLQMEALPVFDRSQSLRHRAGMSVLSQSYTGLYLQDELLLFQEKLRFTIAGRLTTAKDSQYGRVTDETVLTPRVGASYSLNSQTSVYALYDQAFVPQAGVDFSGKRFDPITGDNIEAGVKRDWHEGRWNTSVSVYQITKNNVLTADPEHINFSVQMGQTQTSGVEVDVKGEVFTGLDLTWNYAYTDSRVTKDTNPERVNVAVPGATKHITNAWLAYRLPQRSLNGMGISLGYQWQLERSSWFVFDGTEKSLPDYFRLDGAVSWRNENFNIALNVNNILNKYLFSGSPYGNYYYWQTEAPRNFRITVGYKF